MSDGGHGGVKLAGAKPQLADLYRAHAGEIASFISRTFGQGPPEPEDAVQAAFAQYAALDEPRNIENPRAFLFRSARNFVLDFRRRQGTQRRFAHQVEENFHETPATDDAQRVLEGKERLGAILATVRALEPRRRKVLIWHAIHELTFTEIAKHLGVSQARVRQLFAEALASCEARARLLDDDGGGS